MNRKGLWGELIAEVFGTFVLILLGDGVVAQVATSARLASEAYDWNTIAFGWGFAVVMAVYVAGGVSGAHINPAVTFAMAVKRGFAWSKVVPYWIAQIVGAFLGALAVYLVYLQGLVEAGMPNVWSTAPGALFDKPLWGDADLVVNNVGSYPFWNAGLAEIIGTAMLLIGVAAMIDPKNLGPKSNMAPLLIGFVVLSIGLSLGGPSGYAINPARDFGPRIFGTIAGTKDLWSGGYWYVPIVFPLIGGAIGILLYDYLITPFLPEKEEEAEPA
jgi:glycerol uptake facilitator protein